MIKVFSSEIQTILDTIEKRGFSIYPYEEGGVVCGVEIEGWTNGGVDMVHFIDLRDKDINNPDDWKEEISQIASGFDVDEEIDLYRQDEGYRKAFSCRESVVDFEDWQEQLYALAQSVLYPEIV